MAQSPTLRPRLNLCVCVCHLQHILSPHTEFREKSWTLMYGDKCWPVLNEPV